MHAAEILEALDARPRLGLLDGATPVVSCDGLAQELGLDWLGVKRDDRIDALFGGTKVRKLDFLLATEPYASAPEWVATGAIGSGLLVALVAAAQHLRRDVRAHLFRTPSIDAARENLAFVAGGATTLSVHRSRLLLGLRHPELLVAGRSWGMPVVPIGASSPAGMVGTVRAGLELAAQIDRGELPAPDRVYVALGSGGTAAGIALGLALGGRATPVLAVAAVERLLSGRRRVESLVHDVREYLVGAGVGLLPLARDLDVPIQIVRGYLGSGYGAATDAAVNACERLRDAGIDLEPIYSGKAMAALLARERSGRVLFWSTRRRRGPLPHEADWQTHLPSWLRRALRD